MSDKGKSEKRRKDGKRSKSRSGTSPTPDAQMDHPQPAKSKAKKRGGATPLLNGRTPARLDPLLLARGMSSRYLSSRVSHGLTPLAKDDIDKDLRHMEAYRNACDGYSQQLFAWRNQELVRGGYFGSFAPIAGGDGAVQTSSKFSMPSRIDPEEEKRLSLLRKRIHQSEFERERLETEYLSLRAHYVHESQLARKTQAYEAGRWELLREAMARRAKVLGLMRAKIAMGRDVECLLKYRGGLAEKAKNGAAPTENGAPVPEDKKDNAGVDLVEVWNGVNAQLKEAELACSELETPAVLSQMVSDQTLNGSRSPKRDGGKGPKRSGSTSSDNDPTNKAETHLIPWDCAVEPRTPYEVPLLLSCLSSATDRAVGYLTDKTAPAAMTWLESTLPESTAAYDGDAKDLAKLRDEVRILEEELKQEGDRNTELQKQIVVSRKRGDEMVSLMGLLRSETEAVLERHNVIMETPEACAKSAELYKKLLEEERLKNPPGEGEEDGDENESSGEDDDDDDEGSDDGSVGIKEITVDKDGNVAGESDDESETANGGTEEGDGEPGDEGEPRRSKRRGDGDEESSSLTPPNNQGSKKRRRY
ncbi:hypothetical protein ACHAXT_011236 [Thalassiosira profunda]